jgi:transcriptional regulator with XRE-family HTH domain
MSLRNVPLGVAIRNLRHQRGWTLESLAREALITPETLSKIEHGRRPLPRTIDALAAALNVSSETLYQLAMVIDPEQKPPTASLKGSERDQAGEQALVRSGGSPRAFISYSWESRDHKSWVKELSMRLRLDGVELILDQWELQPGDQLTEFMEKSVRTSDSVLIVCTPAYKAKSNNRAGGVGYEGSVITAELFTGTSRRKFIPLHRKGEWKDAAPSWLLGSFYLDFRGDNGLEESYLDLLKTLHARREVAPPVGSPPFPDHHRAEQATPADGRRTPRGGDASRAYPFVLQTMVQSGGADPTTIAMGREWLRRTSHSEPAWPQVWNALIKTRPDEDLIQFGYEWLRNTTLANPTWTHVWNTLMNVRPNDPELIAMGRDWLTKN